MPYYTKEVLASWINEAKDLFAVSLSDGTDDRLYVEMPDEHLLRDDDKEETLLRVFIAKEDATRYRDAIRETSDLKPPDGMGEIRLDVVVFSMKVLFDMFGRMNKESIEQYGCPIRLELCEMPPNSHPVRLDTLWSDFETKH
ncbi:MAG: hypothetical protein NVS9B9_16530 [Ktedonobacteraceae bacterium]